MKLDEVNIVIEATLNELGCRNKINEMTLTEAGEFYRNIYHAIGII